MKIYTHIIYGTSLNTQYFRSYGYSQGKIGHVTGLRSSAGTSELRHLLKPLWNATGTRTNRYFCDADMKMLRELLDLTSANANYILAFKWTGKHENRVGGCFKTAGTVYFAVDSLW